MIFKQLITYIAIVDTHHHFVHFFLFPLLLFPKYWKFFHQSGTSFRLLDIPLAAEVLVIRWKKLIYSIIVLIKSATIIISVENI